jgi:DNA polymerase-3 subunit epsilon
VKNLKLNRPLAFIDLETTGLHPHSDRIVELSILKIHPDGTKEYHSRRINPGVPIPPEATAVHGITDDDVADKPKFGQFAKSIRDFLEGCDIAGFNVIAFDLPCLESELERVGVEFSRQGRYLVDTKTIYHQREPRDLQAAYQKYCGREMGNAHVAEEDAKASAEILEGQLEMYKDLPRDVAGLCALCYKVEDNYIDAEGNFIWLDGEAICNFGKKHRGRKLQDIAREDPGYLSWVAGADFSAEVKKVVINALDGKFPQQPETL